MSIVTKQIREGTYYRFRILAVAERTEDSFHCPTFDFFEYAECKEPDDVGRLSAILDYLAEHGALRNEQKFKHLTGSDQIFEIKTPHGLRLYCFFDEGQVIVCTNGEIKKRQKATKSEVEKAEKWRGAYFAAQQLGTLKHEPEHQ